MESLMNLFISGPGPSSSHTIGPKRAALDFVSDLKTIERIDVYLYGSLSLTGKGHFTDKILLETLKDYNPCVHFSSSLSQFMHPNTLKFEARNNGKIIKKQVYISVGGGKILKAHQKDKSKEIYPFKNFDEIKNYVESRGMNLIEFVDSLEESSINEYLSRMFDKMVTLVENNLNKTGYLPGELKTKRAAKEIYERAINLENNEEKYLMLISSFAYSCSEGNASNDEVVTAPTCGSCGVLPAVLYYEYKFNKVSKEKIVKALKVAGIFGNVCKQNASVSGAMMGCQAEIGVACSMAAAALSYIHDLNLYQIEFAAESALEHFLGLTCDPVGGYVHIPCIERNGVGAMRAYSSYLYAKNIAPYKKNKVSFDNVVAAMKETGLALNQDFKETAIGGLARLFRK